MAGGVGTKFWPLSRIKKPKQFIDILGTGETLIEQTYNRFAKICPKENIYVVTTNIYKQQVLDLLPGLSEKQVVSEPSRRNTAPCVAYASYKIADKNPHANIVVAPSDHIITKEDRFCKIVEEGLEVCEKNDWLITLGISPSRPDTGYGYIQFKEKEIYPEMPGLKKVKTFTEKPGLEMAKQFIQSGDFLWNSGIFIWSLDAIKKAINKHLPEVDSVFKEGEGKYNTDQEEKFIQEAYSICRSISIDYGIMEKADNVYVLQADFGWSDLGTWGSLYDHSEKDNNGNTIVGNNVVVYNTQNCVVNMPKDKLVVIHGLDDYIVIESDNTLLICKKADEQKIKQFVNDVKIEKGEQYV